MCDNKCLKKKRLQLKGDVEKLRKQAEVRRGEMKAKWQSVANEINLLDLEFIVLPNL